MHRPAFWRVPKNKPDPDEDNENCIYTLHTPALAGTPAEGELKPGDVITKIGDHDARHLSHKEAQNLFKHAGNNIGVVVQRGGAPKPASAPTSPPLPTAILASLQQAPVAGGVATPFATAAAAQRVNPPAPQVKPPTPVPAPNFAPLQVQTEAPTLPEFITHNPILPARGPNSLNALLSPRVNSSPLPNNDYYAKTIQSPVQNLPVTTFPPPLPGFTPFDGQPRRALTPNPYAHYEVIDSPDCIDQQPYRTTPLVLPGAKNKREVPITSYMRHHPNPAVRAAPHHFDNHAEVLMKQKVADTVLERVAGPDAANKKVIHQFNSPIGLYSEQNIVDTVQSQTGQAGVTPYKGRKTLYYDPAKSETFKALQDELGGVMMEIPEPVQPKVFTPAQKHVQPPINQMQKRPQPPRSPQPNYVSQLGGDEKIHQSHSFRRLMNEVLGESEF